MLKIEWKIASSIPSLETYVFPLLSLSGDPGSPTLPHWDGVLSLLTIGDYITHCL
jgi:hypothetical protein